MQLVELVGPYGLRLFEYHYLAIRHHRNAAANIYHLTRFHIGREENVLVEHLFVLGQNVFKPARERVDIVPFFTVKQVDRREASLGYIARNTFKRRCGSCHIGIFV